MDEFKLVSESFEDALLEKKKPTKKQSNKVAKVMHHWKEGKQHIGTSDKFVPKTKKGQKQAVAIALSMAGLSKKREVNEEVSTDIVGDAQYAKDLQMITVKYNKDLQFLNDNIAKLKAQAMQNLATRQQAAQQKTAAATSTQPAARATASPTPKPVQNESFLLEMVDDDHEEKKKDTHEIDELFAESVEGLTNEAYGEDSILIPREIRDDNDEDAEYIEPVEVEDDQVERDDVDDDDEWEDENLVFYLKLDDKGVPVIAKLYREDEESDWIIDVVQGSNEILDNMAFYQDYDKVQIINYLSEIFDDVEELTEKGYNDIVEVQPKEEVTESSIEYSIGNIREQ